ncbi:uncharacterized protein TRAVEDRAFT_46335 [Trametes versicolor FP-101664 SS1]|uniref:uncharacterized protein n=1 Tax=Trametes versicolor (strain FP-101664) TaxID=717944 RepID=UPI0004623DAE|nr:uncharacterized protein TRAVEDRAFT_46335 [Trametes versicolor FP-101664 SS1]EIW61112.1 hypothetical protein TRAVEDRAFT_46335 [Trametes versicolor FP-101664 SS1]
MAAWTDIQILNVSPIPSAARDSAQAHWATVRVAWPTSTATLPWGGNADARPSPSVTSSTRTHEIAAGNPVHARSTPLGVGARHRKLILQLSRHAPLRARAESSAACGESRGYVGMFNRVQTPLRKPAWLLCPDPRLASSGVPAAKSTTRISHPVVEATRPCTHAACVAT